MYQYFSHPDCTVGLGISPSHVTKMTHGLMCQKTASVHKYRRSRISRCPEVYFTFLIIAQPLTVCKKNIGSFTLCTGMISSGVTPAAQLYNICLHQKIFTERCNFAVCQDPCLSRIIHAYASHRSESLLPSKQLRRNISLHMLHDPCLQGAVI
jgi:hypothetical protein